MALFRHGIANLAYSLARPAGRPRNASSCPFHASLRKTPLTHEKWLPQEPFWVTPKDRSNRGRHVTLNLIGTATEKVLFNLFGQIFAM